MSQQRSQSSSTASGPGPANSPQRSRGILPEISAHLGIGERVRPVPQSGSHGPDRQTIGQAAGGVGASALVMARLRQQINATSGHASPLQGSRLGALQAAAQFRAVPGSVGAGVYSGISAIHLALGNTMQAHIGDVFRANPAQQLMAQPAGGLPGIRNLLSASARHMGQGFGPANWALATGEHTYWGAQMRNAVSTVMGRSFPPAGGVANQIGGAIGTAFRPFMRATAQSIAARNPYVFPIMAAAGMVTGSTWAGGRLASTNDVWRQH